MITSLLLFSGGTLWGIVPPRSLQEYKPDIMRLINLTCPTYPEEIKQELEVNSFIEGLHCSESSQILRMARQKKISEALDHALHFEIAKRTSMNQERIIRRIKFSPDQ